MITTDISPWIKYYERLKHSANQLLPNIERFAAYLNDENEEIRKIIPEFERQLQAEVEAYMLLKGYSIENLIKAALMRKYELENPLTKFKNFKELKEKVWRNVNGHELVKLIEKNKILNLYKAESALLEILEEYIKWAGRYEYSHNLQPRTEEVIKKIKKDDWEEDILKQLEYRLFEQIKNGW